MKKYILLTRSIVIVNTYWQISGHIGHREPTFNGEIYTHILLIQLKKKNKIILHLCSQIQKYTGYIRYNV